MKNNKIKDRIRKCRMIEKMELQRKYSEKIGLKNVSTFQTVQREKRAVVLREPPFFE